MSTPRFSWQTTSTIFGMIVIIIGSTWYMASRIDAVQADAIKAQSAADYHFTLNGNKIEELKLSTEKGFASNDKQHEEIKATINKLSDRINNNSRDRDDISTAKK